MACYRRAKFTVDAFRNISSRITHNRNPIQESIFQRSIHQCTNPTKGSFHEFNKLASPSLRRSFTSNHGLLNQNNANRFFLCGTKRFYSIFKPEAPGGNKRWFEKQSYQLIMVLGLGIGAAFSICDLETIPYTKRKHFVCYSTETSLDKKDFDDIKAGSEGEVLDEKHPQSKKVKLIVENITKNLREKVVKEGDDTATSHLKYMSWEIVVVDKPDVSAYCLPRGKIVVSTGVLNRCTSDAEIAIVIGREVAHIVAQHYLESGTKAAMCYIPLMLLCYYKQPLQGVWGIILMMVINQLFDKYIFDPIENLFQSLPGRLRLHETEADYIGVMLAASAGYDPRVAPKVYKRVGEVLGDDWRTLGDCYSISEERVQLLDKARGV